jgi:hypothetical protein
MNGQLSIFDFIKQYSLYDGYEVSSTKSILSQGYKVKLIKGDKYYLICEHDGICNLSIPNKYGGSYGFTVTEKQLIENFKKLNLKVYPISREIWNGSKWISNPILATS